MVIPPTCPEWSSVLHRAHAISDGGYANFVCRWPLATYEERLRRLGLQGPGRLIDVGCGYGQWSMAAVSLGLEVLAIDRHEGRIDLARRECDRRGLRGVRFMVGDALDLPVDTSSMDVVFCYGVLMFLDQDRALDEFARVLRPGGRLYVCTNGPGWWLRLALQSDAPSMRAAAVRALIRPRGIPSSMTRWTLRRTLRARGWSDVRVDLEGRLAVPSGGARISFYPGRFAGLDEVVEAVATRSKASSGQDEYWPPEVVEQAWRSAAVSRGEDLVAVMRAYPQPRPVLDLVNNTAKERVDRCVALAAATDRARVLSWIFEQTTRSCRTPLQSIEAMSRLTARHFYHHFAGQPMTCPGKLLLDPVAAFVGRVGRCGHAARFLYDALACAGLKVRLIGGACHTAVEVLLDGRWILLDPSLFPMGLPLAKKSHEPMTLDWLAMNPHELDRIPSFVNYHAEHIEAVLSDYPELEEPIGDYLRHPILPSVAYFGRAFAGQRRPGTVQRIVKRGGPSSWNSDPDFGWGDTLVHEELAGIPVTTVQRPAQVSSVTVEGDQVVWAPVSSSASSSEVEYEVWSSPHSRGWNYQAWPDDGNFRLCGRVIVTRDCRARIERGSDRFVSIVSRPVGSPEVFCLPSREFQI
jgi:SAM-dependent methyltransferase